jgi:cold shock protein
MGIRPALGQLRRGRRFSYKGHVAAEEAYEQPESGGGDVFVHISAVERAGLRDLREGQKISYELVADRRTGKSSADNLKSSEG